MRGGKLGPHSLARDRRGAEPLDRERLPRPRPSPTGSQEVTVPTGTSREVGAPSGEVLDPRCGLDRGVELWGRRVGGPCDTFTVCGGTDPPAGSGAVRFGAARGGRMGYRKSGLPAACATRRSCRGVVQL